MESGENQRRAYDCGDCPAICCTVYEAVSVDDADARRLARHLGLTPAAFVALATRRGPRGETILRRKPDLASGTGECCAFLDTQTRRCKVYDARPEVCRDFPAEKAREGGRCAYYDLLRYVRRESGDPDRVPLVQIVRLVA